MAVLDQFVAQVNGDRPDSAERARPDRSSFSPAILYAHCDPGNFGGPPAIVQLATPAGSDEPIPAVGDGNLTEPGRYAMVCFIPQGVDPQAYMDAAESSGDGPPHVAGGPPRATLGMYAELAVEG